MAERKRGERRGRRRQRGIEEILTPQPTTDEKGRRHLERLKRKVTAGKQTRDRWRESYQVDALAKAAYGPRQEAESEFPDDTVIWINKFDPTIKTLLPSLIYQAPTFKFDPMSGETSVVRAQQAKTIQALVKRVCLENHQLENAARLALAQSMHSIAVVKLIYDPTLEPNPRAGEPIYETDDADQPILDEMTGQPRPLRGEDGEALTEPDKIVKDEVYKIAWVNGQCMIFPPRVADPRKWGWVAEEVTVSVEEAREDERFKPELRKKIKSNVTADDETVAETIEPGQEWADEEEGDFRYIEFYDHKKKRYYAWADGSPDSDLEQELLFDRPLPKGFEDNCYAILPGFTRILDPKPHPWPLPLTYNWLPIEREHNARRQQLTNGANRSTRKYYYDTNTFPDHEQAERSLQSPVDMEGVQVNDVQRPPVVVVDPPPPSNIREDLQALEGDWIRATGLSSSAFGVRSGSATEARLENQAGDIRESDLRRDVALWMETIGRKLFNLIKATMTIGVMVKIASMTDREVTQALNARFGDGTAQQLAAAPALKQAFVDRFGEENWLEVNREDITFDADISVVPGSMKSRTIEMERQQFLEFMQIVLSSPIGLQSRELLTTVASLFEFVDDKVVEELVALGEKSAALEAQKAGRFQGDDQGAAGQQAVAAAAGAAAPQAAANPMTLQSLLGG